MLSLLVAVRDALLAIALAWVGITLEERAAEHAPAEPSAEASRDR
ncbi:hypothetical protein [Vitreimonas sp.]